MRARRPLLQEAVARALRDHLLETSARADIHLLAFHIEPEHVHVVLSPRPEMTMAAAVQRLQLKGASSRHLRQAFPHLHELHRDALWSTGYSARSLVGVSVAQAYLDRQRAQHGV